MLFVHALGRIKKGLRLEVRTGNEGARAFYNEHGLSLLHSVTLVSKPIHIIEIAHQYQCRFAQTKNNLLPV